MNSYSGIIIIKLDNLGIENIDVFLKHIKIRLMASKFTLLIQNILLIIKNLDYFSNLMLKSQFRQFLYRFEAIDNKMLRSLIFEYNRHLLMKEKSLSARENDFELPKISIKCPSFKLILL